MLHVLMSIAKWASIPFLLTASVLSRFTADYELLVDCAICLGAIVVVVRAVQSKNYIWAAGFAAIAVVFSPVLLVLKVFALVTLTCLAAVSAAYAALRPHPSPAH